MYICPECGEKLNKDATICPCCGRGNKNNIKAKMYILCYRTKVMTFYIIHSGKNYQKAEEKLFDIFKNLKLN